jgi:probable rRNA maturation factor
MTIEVLIEDPRWSVAGLPALAEPAARAALAAAGLGTWDWDISLLACDDARIAALNAQFRGKAAPTNVLSWPSANRAPDTPGATPPPPDPDDPELGDIAIAYDICAAEAKAQGLPFDHHVTHLIVHGVLHLLGYDHETDKDAARMESLEVRILAELGIPDPY